MLVRFKKFGYTIDQTVLIIFLIAILVTVIVVSLGLNIITRGEGTRLASQLKQIESAIKRYEADIGVLPYQALCQSYNTCATGGWIIPEYWGNSLATNNLHSSTPFFARWRGPYINAQFDTSAGGSNSWRLLHGLVSLPDPITQWNIPLIQIYTLQGASPQPVIIMLSRISRPAAEEADRIIDGGTQDFTTGNFRAIAWQIPRISNWGAPWSPPGFTNPGGDPRSPHVCFSDAEQIAAQTNANDMELAVCYITGVMQ